MIDIPGSASGTYEQGAYTRSRSNSVDNSQQQQLEQLTAATASSVQDANKELSSLAGYIQSESDLSPADKKKVGAQRTLKLKSSIAALRRDVSALNKTAGNTHILPLPPEPKTQSPAMLALALYSLQVKFQSSRVKFAEKRIQNTKSEILSQDKKSIHKWLEKIKASSQSNVGALVGKIFGWVAVVLTFVAAAVVTIVSGGVAGACMFAAAFLMLGFMIFQEAHGMSALANALHLNAHQRMIMSLCISAAVALVSLILCAPSGFGLIRGAINFVSECIEIGTEVGSSAAGMAGEAIAEGADTAEAALTTADEAATTATELTSEAENATESLSESVENLATDTDKLVENATEEGGNVRKAASSIEKAEEEVQETGKEAMGKIDKAEKALQKSAKSSSKLRRAMRGLAKKLATSKKNVSTTATKVATKEGFKAGLTKFMTSPKVQNVMTKVQGATQLATGVASVAGGAAEIDSGVYGFEASNLAADSKDIDAETTRLLGIMDQDKKRLKEILQTMQDETSQVIKILDSSSSATRSALV